MQDWELLQKYASTGSDEAFTELVNRHLGLVYSTALRRVGDPHLAEEVTQAVFALLAEKARLLRSGVILAGWLYKTACFKAAQQQRAEARRLKYQKEAAAMQQEVHSPSQTDAAWKLVEPLLDDAMQHLGETDRAAILLRFFQRKRLREVGLALGLEEEAARKRVDRALTKLRDWFASRGVAYPAASLAAVLSVHAIQAAPTLLPAAISAAALKTVPAVTGTITFTKLIQICTAMKLKTVLITTSVLLVGTLVILQRQKRPFEPLPELALVERPAVGELAAEPSPNWRRFDAMRQAHQTETTADDSLRAALSRLREALYAPPAQGSPNEDSAREIMKAIPVENRAAALQMVTDALRSSEEHVCLRAIGLVPYIWPQGEAAIPTLFDLVRSRSEQWPEVASAALIAASQAKSEPVVVPELVAAAMEGPASAHRALTAQLPLLKSFIPQSETAFVASLQPYLYSFDPQMRFTAAQALAQLPGPKDPAVVSELVSILKSPGDGTAPTAEQIRASLEGLRQMGPEATVAIPALIQFREQNAGWNDIVNIALKALAPEELAGVGVPTPLPPLDPVAAALADQIERGTIPPAGLAAALENPSTALIAARALAEFGPNASEALPAVRQAFNAAVQTNLSAALVLSATIERLDPRAPKPLLLALDVMPALEAVHAEAQKANHPDWNRALETLPQRVSIGMAFRHEDLRNIAEELKRVDPSLQNAFIQELLKRDREFAKIFQPAQ